jgi:hypothetical protein
MNIETRIQKLLVDRPSVLVPPGADGGYDVCFGAGGIKGYAHIGVKQGLDDLEVPLRILRGCSAGTDMVLLIANGRTPRQMLDINERERVRVYTAAAWQEFYRDSVRAMMCALSGNAECQCDLQGAVDEMMSKIRDSMEFWQRALIVPTPQQFAKSPSFISLEGLWQDVIAKEHLLPSPNLEIVAFCLADGRPVFYRGSDANPTTSLPESAIVLPLDNAAVLAKAVAGSGSLPGVFAPVMDGPHLIGDGAMYHYNPTVGLREPAIVVRLGRATKWPAEPLSLLDAGFTFREVMNLQLMPTSQDVDETRHIVIDIPCDDVAGLAFGISKQRRLELIEEAYDVTIATISEAIKQGRIILSKQSA